MAVITIVSTYLATETFREDIHAEHAAERDLAREAEARGDRGERGQRVAT